MDQSDFITIISILVAIIAICVANNKKIWIYKFSWLSIIIGILSLLIINGLIFYDDLIKRCPKIEILSYANGLHSKTWAYIISIAFLLGLCIYISKCKYFPKRNYDKIIKYYRDLVDSNPSILLSYIDIYHKDKIQKLIKQYSELGEKEKNKNFFQVLGEEKKFQKKKKQLIKPFLEHRIILEIILSKHFIDKTMPIAPFWFLETFAGITTDRIVNFKESIEYYIQRLIQEKNGEFIEEINEMFWHDDKDILTLLKETKYLKYLFSDNYFITRFDLLQVIGEEAIREAETGKKIFSDKKNNWKEGEYKQTICYQCMLLYNIAYRYLAEHKPIIKNTQNVTPDEYKYFPHFEYLVYICQALHITYKQFGPDTYAHVYIYDTLSQLNQTLSYCEKKNLEQYKSSIQSKINDIRKIQCSNVKQK